MGSVKKFGPKKLGSVKSSSSSHTSFSDNSENSEKAETLFPLPVIKKEIRQRR